MLVICTTISQGYQGKRDHGGAVTGSWSRDKHVAGTVQGWESPMECLLEDRHSSSLSVINQVVRGRERRAWLGGWVRHTSE